MSLICIIWVVLWLVAPSWLVVLSRVAMTTPTPHLLLLLCSNGVFFPHSIPRYSIRFNWIKSKEELNGLCRNQWGSWQCNGRGQCDNPSFLSDLASHAFISKPFTARFAKLSTPLGLFFHFPAIHPPSLLLLFVHVMPLSSFIPFSKLFTLTPPCLSSLSSFLPFSKLFPWPPAPCYSPPSLSSFLAFSKPLTAYYFLPFPSFLPWTPTPACHHDQAFFLAPSFLQCLRTRDHSFSSSQAKRKTESKKFFFYLNTDSPSYSLCVCVCVWRILNCRALATLPGAPLRIPSFLPLNDH